MALAALADDPRLAEYQPYWAARARLEAQVGNVAAADQAYQLAIGLESDPAVRAFLQKRRSALSARRPTIKKPREAGQGSRRLRRPVDLHRSMP